MPKVPKIVIHFMSHLSKVKRSNFVCHTFVMPKVISSHFNKSLTSRTYAVEKNLATIVATNQTHA
jgi:hypothetical protein